MTRMLLRLCLYVAALCLTLLLCALLLGRILPSSGQLVYYSTAGNGTLQSFDISLHITTTLATRVARVAFFPSPNGQQILFFRPQVDIPNPYIINLDGSNLRHVEAASLTYNIVWMPDNAHLIIVELTGDTFSLIDLNDFGQETLFQVDAELCPLFQVSPDGQFLALQMLDANICSVSVTEIDGSHITNYLTETPSLLSVWSPDSQRLALYNSVVLYVVPDVTQDAVFEVRNMHLRATISALSWSHDGTRIVFSADNALDIFVVNVESQIGYARNLTITTSEEYYPVWLPSGNEIAFISNRDHGNGEIYVMNDDGSNVRRLTFNDEVESLLVWLP